MNKRIALAVIALLVMIAPVGIAAASDVSGALYKVVITVGNVGTAATNVATVVTVKSPNLITGGYANSSVNNIALRNSSGVDIPFMPGNSTNDMVIYVPSIGASDYQQNLLYLAESTGGSFVYFPGDTGMTVTDNASLEPGNQAWSITIKGVFIGTNTGLARSILLKGAVPAIRLQYAAGTDNQIDARINNGALDLQIDGVTTGLRTLVLSSAGGGANITLAAYDAAGALIDSDTGVGPAAITNNADDWYFCNDDSTLYMEYANFTLAGAALCYWDWNYGATFTDNVSNVVATPTFRTTTSDADVTATAGLFTIIDPAEASASALAAPSDFYSTPTITGATFTTGTVSPTFPGADVITAIATATSTPNNLPLTIIAGVTILILSLSVSALMRRGGSGSLIIKMVLIAGLLGVAVATKVFDLWMPIVFLLLASAVAMGSQQRGWN